MKTALNLLTLAFGWAAATVVIGFVAKLCWLLLTAGWSVI